MFQARNIENSVLLCISFQFFSLWFPKDIFLSTDLDRSQPEPGALKIKELSVAWFCNCTSAKEGAQNG